MGEPTASPTQRASNGGDLAPTPEVTRSVRPAVRPGAHAAPIALGPAVLVLAAARLALGGPKPG